MSTLWQDASVPLDAATTVFPDTPPVEIERVAALERGDDANVSAVRMSTHSGTHLDAPLHFLPSAAPVDQLDPEAMNGDAEVLDARGGRRIGAETVEAAAAPGRRLLLRSDNSAGGPPPWYRREFDPGYAHLTPEAARVLASAGVALIGLDYLSIGGEGIDNEQTHRILLEGGVTVLEGLALEEVEPGPVELRCLPLRISDGDGAPARAMLRAR
jgi:arylformamidase